MSVIVRSLLTVGRSLGVSKYLNPVGGGAGPAFYHTDFNGSENPLSEGGVWDVTATLGVYEKVLGVARPTAATTQCGARLNAPVFASDQWVEFVVVGAFNAYAGSMTRMQSVANPSGYVLFASIFFIQLYRYDAPAAFNLLASYGPAAGGDTIRLKSVGNGHQAFLNGVALGVPVIDGTYIGGQPGIESFASPGVNNADITSWTASDV